jgi:hypothetical protein
MRFGANAESTSPRLAVPLMGILFYGGNETPLRFDDDTLAHLKVVIATKLRRGESFTLSWRHADDDPRGRTTLWLSPAIPLRFQFDSAEQNVLSREWLQELANSANSSAGIVIVPDPARQRLAPQSA